MYSQPKNSVPTVINSHGGSPDIDTNDEEVKEGDPIEAKMPLLNPLHVAAVKEARPGSIRRCKKLITTQSTTSMVLFELYYCCFDNQLLIF